MARRQQRQIPAAEWIASLIAALIVLATIAVLAFQALRPGDQDPVLTIAVLGIRERSGSFVVDVEVRNVSRGAAADVHLAGNATITGGRDVEAEARLDYVPGFSSRRASLMFASDPGKAPAVRIVGYARP